jgi:hypothetical protein
LEKLLFDTPVFDVGALVYHMASFCGCVINLSRGQFFIAWHASITLPVFDVMA